jgi:NAD(P)-dependent dehydrogenase (short-subunit alcohol dehydrogenase family)
MNILINGGSRGIGRETALHLASDKTHNIIITGRDEASLMETCSSAAFKNISFVLLDLKEYRLEEESFKKQVSDHFANIDILINNAGNLAARKFKDANEDEIREMMEINFFAPAAMIRTFLPLFRNGSHIVNISSMGGFQGSAKFDGLSYYSASKAAIACLSECLAHELSEHGISVNCLALGSVNTAMLNEAFPGYIAPVKADEMGKFIADFALTGNKLFNGKILPIALSTP